MIDAVMIIMLTITKFVKYKPTWWCDGVMMRAWCDQPNLTLPGFQSDHTLGYKTRCDIRAIIKSLTTQHNTHSTLTLLNSLVMSMINSYQFHTTTNKHNGCQIFTNPQKEEVGWLWWVPKVGGEQNVWWRSLNKFWLVLNHTWGKEGQRTSRDHKAEVATEANIHYLSKLQASTEWSLAETSWSVIYP